MQLTVHALLLLLMHYFFLMLPLSLHEIAWYSTSLCLNYLNFILMLVTHLIFGVKVSSASITMSSNLHLPHAVDCGGGLVHYGVSAAFVGG